GDEIHAGPNRRLPTLTRGLKRSEVVAFRPSARGVAWIVPVQRIKANPESRLVRGLHNRVEPRLVLGRPGAGLRLTTGFHDAPGVVPPAVVIRANAGGSGLQRTRFRGTEHQQVLSDRDVVIKGLPLRIGFASQHE